MPVDAAYRRISEREFGFALGAYDTNHSRVIDLARLSRAACSRAFGGVLREIAGDVAESEGGLGIVGVPQADQFGQSGT